MLTIEYPTRFKANPAIQIRVIFLADTFRSSFGKIFTDYTIKNSVVLNVEEKIFLKVYNMPERFFVKEWFT